MRRAGRGAAARSAAGLDVCAGAPGRLKVIKLVLVLVIVIQTILVSSNNTTTNSTNHSSSNNANVKSQDCSRFA